MEALPKPQGGDQNRGPAFLIVALLFFAFALMSVLLRLFARVRVLGLTGWDDLLISLAMVSALDPPEYVRRYRLARFDWRNAGF